MPHLTTHNLFDHKALAQTLRGPVVKTATATLTLQEVRRGLILGNHASTQVDLTLPAAAEPLRDVEVAVACLGAASTTVTDPTSSFAITLTTRDRAVLQVITDGTTYEWSFTHHSAPA